MHHPSPSSFLALLAQTNAPVLTWYSAQGRVELSGPVLAKWLSKTMNLLEEESLIDRGTINIRLPSNWRTVIWTAAAWLAGWTTDFSGSPFSAPSKDTADSPRKIEIYISDSQDEIEQISKESDSLIVAQAIEPLALHWPGQLPPGAVDGIAEVSAQPDDLLVEPEVALDEKVSVLTSGRKLYYGALFKEDSPTNQAKTQLAKVRYGLETEAVDTLTLKLLQIWAQEDSAVVIDFPPDSEHFNRIISQEQVTRHRR